MRRRLARLAGAVCGLCLVVACTSEAEDPVGQARPNGAQPEDSASAWPGPPGVQIGDQSSRWWPVASKRAPHPTGIEVVASSGLAEMVVDGAGVIWLDMQWGLVRLDPATWSATVWDAGDDAAFASHLFVRASAASGVWLVEGDRVQLFDGVRFARDIQVPSAYPGEGEEAGIRDVVEVGSEIWVASETGVVRSGGDTWSTVGEGLEGLPDGVERLQPTPWGEVWVFAGLWESAVLRYDGTRWALIDRPHADEGLHSIAWDPAGRMVAVVGHEVMRHDGSAWEVLGRLDEADADGEAVWVEGVAATRDGSVCVLTGGEVLRSGRGGDWRSITSPHGSPPTGLAVSGEHILVSSSAGVHRVAGDELELVWSAHQAWAVVPDIATVVTVAGDEAWIVTDDWWEGRDPAVSLRTVQVGRTDPVRVASLPASALGAYGGPEHSTLGSVAVTASDGAIWYVVDESVMRIADGTQPVVVGGLRKDVVGEHLVNVTMVATNDVGPDRADPRPREIGPAGFAELAVPGRAIEQTLFGDGDIRCPDHWAHDPSLPLGRVQYTPTAQGIEIAVTLDQAWPHTVYRVDVNTDQSCWTGGFADLGQESDGWWLTTDRDGPAR